MAACPYPFILIFLGSNAHLLKSLVSEMRGGNTDLRHWLTLLPLSALLRNCPVAQVIHNPLEGIVAKDETTNGDEKQFVKHF